MDNIYYLSLILLSGLIMGKIISYLKLPDVTGYLIGGVLIGPSLLGLIPNNAVSQLETISQVALGFIAYSIGSEFNFKHIKKLGSGVLLVTVLEALGAVILVDLSMIFIFRQEVAFSIVLGAIAAATAPAATLMVVRQYKARGPLVNTLLPVVAMDDAVCIMVFGISSTIAITLLDKSAKFSVTQALIFPLLEILGAIVLGITLGICLCFISKKITGEDRLLSVTIAILLLALGLALKFNVSTLLTCMSIGATITNLMPNNKKIFSVIDRFTPPIFIAFFTISGATLDISLLKDIGIVGIGYILIRVLGKILGAGLGAKIANMPKTVQKYLGMTLIPQAGVAIGLAMIGANILPKPYGSIIRTIILSATVVYELIGPLITKTALFKAGEANCHELKSSNKDTIKV